MLHAFMLIVSDQGAILSGIIHQWCKTPMGRLNGKWRLFLIINCGFCQVIVAAHSRRWLLKKSRIVLLGGVVVLLNMILGNLLIIWQMRLMVAAYRREHHLDTFDYQ
jgi:hypothetical protein